jgi:hypothetical protein
MAAQGGCRRAALALLRREPRPASDDRGRRRLRKRLHGRRRARGQRRSRSGRWLRALRVLELAARHALRQNSRRFASRRLHVRLGGDAALRSGATILRWLPCGGRARTGRARTGRARVAPARGAPRARPEGRRPHLAQLEDLPRPGAERRNGSCSRFASGRRAFARRRRRRRRRAAAAGAVGLPRHQPRPSACCVRCNHFCNHIV